MSNNMKQLHFDPNKLENYQYNETVAEKNEGFYICNSIPKSIYWCIEMPRCQCFSLVQFSLAEAFLKSGHIIECFVWNCSNMLATS